MLVFDKHDIAGISHFIKQGGVIAYPSESVWGLGCDGFNAQAIARILTLKNRPAHKGLIVLCHSQDCLSPFLQAVPHQALERLSSPSPSHQAQTWLVPIGAVKLPQNLTGDFDTLAIRITSHPTLQAICQSLVCPANPFGFLVSTSCNPSAQPPAHDLSTAMAYFGDMVAYVDDESLGFEKPSQIIELLTGKVLR